MLSLFSLSKIKQQPEKKRKQFLFLASFILTAIITAFWLTGYGIILSEQKRQQEISRKEIALLAENNLPLDSIKKDNNSSLRNRLAVLTNAFVDGVDSVKVGVRLIGDKIKIIGGDNK